MPNSQTCPAGHTNTPVDHYCTKCGAPLKNRLLPPDARPAIRTSHPKRRWLWISASLALSLAAGLVLALVVPHDRSSASYSDVGALQRAYMASGMPCPRSRKVIPAHSTGGLTGVVVCLGKGGSDYVVLSTYRSRPDLMRDVRSATKGGPTPHGLIVGVNWLISTPSAEVHEVHSAMGGTVYRTRRDEGTQARPHSTPSAPSVASSPTPSSSCPHAAGVDGAGILCAEATRAMKVCKVGPFLTLVSNADGVAEWQYPEGDYPGTALTSGDLDMGVQLLSCGSPVNRIGVKQMVKAVDSQVAHRWGSPVTASSCGPYKRNAVLDQLPIGQSVAGCYVWDSAHHRRFVDIDVTATAPYFAAHPYAAEPGTPTGSTNESARTPASGTTTSTDCVTTAAFHQVHSGMPEGQVEKIFGTHGKFMQRNQMGQVRSYPACNDPSKVAVLAYFDSASMHEPVQTKKWAYVGHD